MESTQNPRSFTRRLRSLFTRGRTLRNTPRLANLPNADKYKAAGSVFTDGKLILAGYQPKKRKPFISGIGGGKEAGETYRDTALRETLEELFEFKQIPEKLKQEIHTSVIPDKLVQSNTYIMVVYNFQNLEKMLSIVKKYKMVSPLYDTIPTTLFDLLFKRKLDVGSPELSHLALLPLVKHSHSIPFVDAYFIEDMPLLLQ
jgi:hypothetical protein